MGKAKINQIKIFHNLVSLKTLKKLVIEKINSSGSLYLAKMLTGMLNDSEMDVLINKIYNKEIK